MTTRRSSTSLSSSSSSSSVIRLLFSLLTIHQLISFFHTAGDNNINNNNNNDHNHNHRVIIHTITTTALAFSSSTPLLLLSTSHRPQRQQRQHRQYQQYDNDENKEDDTTYVAVYPTQSSESPAVAPEMQEDEKAVVITSTIKKNDKESQRRPEEIRRNGSSSSSAISSRMNAAAKPWRRKDLFGRSLIDQTLLEIHQQHQQPEDRAYDVPSVGMEVEEEDSMSLAAATTVTTTGTTTREKLARRRRTLDGMGIPDFSTFVREQKHEHHRKRRQDGGEGDEFDAKIVSAVLVRKEPKVMQINVGLYCNQACGHCHVESSPLRTEMISAKDAARCLELLRSTPSIQTLDLTGGAPELNDQFRYLVTVARSIRPDIEIIDRCNLTVLQEPGQEDLIQFLIRHRVRIIASLPCYSSENVNRQRGDGVFERSIAALLALNEAGYGVPGTDLRLDLVYNPLGAFLPPEQTMLERQYKDVLAENFGVLFNSLFTMTNLPVKRFADFLHRRGELQDYMNLLVSNYNPSTVQSLMCLDTVSIDHTGQIFDCDFNQQLSYGLRSNDEESGSSSVNGGVTIFDIESLTDLSAYQIRTDKHCFGCTAGQGSS